METEAANLANSGVSSALLVFRSAALTPSKPSPAPIESVRTQSPSADFEAEADCGFCRARSSVASPKQKVTPPRARRHTTARLLEPGELSTEVNRLLKTVSRISEP